MKKISFLLVLGLLFNYCTKEEDPIPVVEPLTYDATKLLKGWSYDTILWDGTVYLYDHNPNCYRDYFGFRNNVGQLYQFEETYFTNTYCTTNSTVMQWEPVGNHINFYFGPTKVDEYEVISLTNDLFTFAIERDINSDTIKEHLIITAIPYDPFHSYSNKTKPTKNTKLFPYKLHL